MSPPLPPRSRDEIDAYEGPARLNSAEQEAQIFWRVRSRIARTVVRHMLRTARLRITLVSVLSLLFWVGLYLLFQEGFQFLASHVGTSGTIHAQTVNAIYNVFFASLMVMLMSTIPSSGFAGLSLNSGSNSASYCTNPCDPYNFFISS